MLAVPHGGGLGGVGDDLVVTDEPAGRPGRLLQPTSPLSPSADARPPNAVGTEDGLAVTPAPKAARTGLPRWTVPVVAVLVLTATTLVSVLLWRWVDGLTFADADKKSIAHLDVLKLAASIAVGGGGLFALYLAARRQRTQELELEKRADELAQRERVQAHAELVAENNRLHAEKVQAYAAQVAETNRVHAERVAEHNREDAAARRVTDLYTKAVEQLGSDKAAVRHGGLYALERVAQDNPAQRQTVINVICAYLRSPFAPPTEQSAARRTGLSAGARQGRAAATTRRIHLTPPRAAVASEQLRQEREVRLTAQRILTAHLRPHTDDTTGLPTTPQYWAEDYDLDLTGAALIDFHASHLTVRHATFTDARFTGSALFRRASFTGDARFDGATFTSDAGFHGTTFTGSALFRGASFTGDARFDGATFTGYAGFRGVSFTGDARFSEATFTGHARFSRASFTSDAGFNGATFARDAQFDETTFTRDARFDGATFTGVTRFGKATFTRDARFAKATFPRNARFNDATFTGVAWFGKATFGGNVWFDGATFIGVARFGKATFADVAVFGNATFAHDALFDETTFARNAWFRGTTFTRDAVFSEASFTGDAVFGDATFGSIALFNGTTFTRDAGFGEATFDGDAWFDGATFTHGAEFGKTTFTGVAVMTGAAAAAASVKWCVWPKGWTIDDHRQGTEASGEAPDILRLVPVPTVLGHVPKSAAIVRSAWPLPGVSMIINERGLR
jgi:hypothetical protein